MGLGSSALNSHSSSIPVPHPLVGSKLQGTSHSLDPPSFLTRQGGRSLSNKLGKRGGRGWERAASTLEGQDSRRPHSRESERRAALAAHSHRGGGGSRARSSSRRAPVKGTAQGQRGPGSGAEVSGAAQPGFTYGSAAPAPSLPPLAAS